MVVIRSVNAHPRYLAFTKIYCKCGKFCMGVNFRILHLKQIFSMQNYTMTQL